jgi:Uma2 family endonuclease
MLILEREVRYAANSELIGLQRHRITCREYRRIAESGAMGNQRLELIEGQLIEVPSPSPAHAAVTDELCRLLDMALLPGFHLRNKVPVSLGDDEIYSEPQPDVVIATGHWRDYVSHHPGPGEIKLVVEVADASLDDDRTVKAALYAGHGISDFWIVNLIENCVEAYRRTDDGGYCLRNTCTSGDSVQLQDVMATRIDVVDFLP